MAVRDPETGQFVSSGAAGYDDVEVITISPTIGIGSSEVTGDTDASFADEGEFEGFELIDMDEVLDRSESADLLAAAHAITVYGQPIDASPGAVRAAIEVSSSPALQAATAIGGSGAELDSDGLLVQQRQDSLDDVKTDSLDIIGRVLSAVAYPPHQDTGSSTGGGGSAGTDDFKTEGFPDRMARFHPRDEVYLNGVIEANGVSVNTYLDVEVQHIYGVRED